MSEFTFDSEGTRDPKVDDTLKFINPVEGDPYEFMSNSYFGTGGFRSGEFLFPHPRELFYAVRRKYSHYRNYVKPIVRALIDPVFMEEAPRLILDENSNEINSETLFGAFIEDCDNNSTKLQSFTETVVTNARLHGVTFIVMDNFPESMQPEVEEAAIAERIFPYVYNVTADRVYTYELDPFGKLQSIVFTEDDVILENGDVEKRYRLWNDEYSQLLTRDQEGKLIAIEPPSFHMLGRVPVLVIMAAKKRRVNELLVDPPLFDIARINLSIYNKDSEIRDQERAQSFSNFYIQTDDTGNITLGPNNVIFIPMASTIPPDFAGPDPQILAGLVENNEKLTEALYQIAEQNGVKGVQSAKSGVAIQWDFYAQESQLKTSSRIATAVEQAIADLFRVYTSTQFVYVVQYPDEFLPGDVSAEIENIKKVFELSPPDSFRNKLMEKAARMMLKDEDEEEVNAIIEDIKKQKQIVTAEETEDETTLGDTEDGEDGETV